MGRQKRGILTTFLRSLDSERYLLEIREDVLKEDLHNISNQDSPDSQDKIAGLKDEIAKVNKEKKKINTVALQVIQCLEEENDANEKTRVAAVADMKEKESDALQADIVET